jgi:lycopene cyclase domain-containing protein
MKYTYLLINLFSVIIPFLFSFHPKIRFDKVWNAFIPSLILTAIIFLAGDVLYTYWGVWGFNPDYLTGIYVVNLPLEEVMFFFCIPYACMFSYHALDRHINFSNVSGITRFVTIPLILILFVLSLLFFDRLYTFAATAGLAALLIIVRFVLNVSWLGKFYIVYLLLLIPFAIVNGMLTGTGLSEPVVWYDNTENMGIRIMSIPFEDIFYGMSLILLNVSGFEYLKRRHSQTKPGLTLETGARA